MIQWVAAVPWADKENAVPLTDIAAVVRVLRERGQCVGCIAIGGRDVVSLGCTLQFAHLAALATQPDRTTGEQVRDVINDHLARTFRGIELPEIQLNGFEHAGPVLFEVSTDGEVLATFRAT